MNKVQIVRRTALILAIILASSLIMSRITRWSEVAAVQNSLQRKYEISINNETLPRYLPTFVDNFVDRFLRKRYESEIGTINRDVVYHQRFRSLFRGPIRDLEIYYPIVFDQRLATAISHLGQLERFGLNEHEGNGSTEEAWEAVLRSAAQLPKLKELEISGGRLTSKAIHRLKSALKLQKLTIEGRLDGTCLDGLENLHELRELNVWSWEDEDGNENGFSRASVAIFLPTLAHLDRLEVLSFDAERATGGQWTSILQSLSRFPNLRELNIGGKSLTNELLAALAGAPRLETLTVNSTVEPSPNNQGLSEASLTKLRAALPNIRVNAR